MEPVDIGRNICYLHMTSINSHAHVTSMSYGWMTSNNQGIPMQCLLEFSNGFLDVIVSLMIVIILNGCHETLSNRDTTHLCSYPNIYIYIYIYIRPGYDVKRPRQRACVSATGFVCQRLLLMWVGLLFVFVVISACYLVVCYVIYYIVYHYITVIYYFLFLFVQTYQKWTHTSSFWESTFALLQCVV